MSAPAPAPGQLRHPGPVFRAQAEDSPPAPPARAAPPAPPVPAVVLLPSAEDLGVRPPVLPPESAEPVDWTRVHRRLGQLGATCFHLEKLPEGRYRITCLLATADPGRERRIEAVGATESDAVRLTMSQAERWATGR